MRSALHFISAVFNGLFGMLVLGFAADESWHQGAADFYIFHRSAFLFAALFVISAVLHAREV